MVGHSCKYALAHPFSCLENGWTACAGIMYVVIDPLAKRLQKLMYGTYVRTCSMRVSMCASIFRISETAGQTALKSGVWLGD